MFTHIIPVNISSDGNLFGGTIKKRNAIEAGIIIGIAFCIMKFALFMVPFIPKIIIFFVIGIAPAAICLIGINDQSAVEYLITLVQYMRRDEIAPYKLQMDNAEKEPETMKEKYEFKAKKKKKKKEEKKLERKRVKEFEQNEKQSEKQLKRLQKEAEKENRKKKHNRKKKGE